MTGPYLTLVRAHPVHTTLAFRLLPIVHARFGSSKFCAQPPNSGGLSASGCLLLPSSPPLPSIVCLLCAQRAARIYLANTKKTKAHLHWLCFCHSWERVICETAGDQGSGILCRKKRRKRHPICISIVSIVYWYQGRGIFCVAFRRIATLGLVCRETGSVAGIPLRTPSTLDRPDWHRIWSTVLSKVSRAI